MAKITLDNYIEILDRLLERQKLSSSERDAIFNDQDNIDLISKSFQKRISPSIVFKQLNKEPAKAMYASLEEAKKKPTTPEGKKKKFKKVMKEFGKGKLKPYHADSSLKSKKQGGSEKEHKQALAIAFSEAGMTKESLNEAHVFPPKIMITDPIYGWKVDAYINLNDFDDDYYNGITLPKGKYYPSGWTQHWVKLENDKEESWVVDRDDLEDFLSPRNQTIRKLMPTYESVSESGKEYAIKFLTSLGLENVTSKAQEKKGTLEFYDKKTDTKWQIASSGYLRKLNNYSQYLKTLANAKKQGWGSHVPQGWQMIYSHFPAKWRNQNVVNKLSDDEYMDMAEIISEKIRNYRKLKSKK